MNKFIPLLFASTLWAVAWTPAAILVEYDFGAGNDLAPSTTEPGFTSESIVLNGLSLDSRGSRLGLTRAASSPTDYISFSLAGNFDFESVVDPINSPGQAGFLTFNTQFHNGSRTPATNYWQVRVSTDDFVSSNIDLGTAGVDPSQSGVVSDPVFDLSGLGLSGNQTLDFRVYLVRSATWNDASMDNLQIQANAIPEPSTFALIGIALGSVLLFRRRKS